MHSGRSRAGISFAIPGGVGIFTGISSKRGDFQKGAPALGGLWSFALGRAHQIHQARSSNEITGWYFLVAWWIWAGRDALNYWYSRVKSLSALLAVAWKRRLKDFLDAIKRAAKRHENYLYPLSPFIKEAAWKLSLKQCPGWVSPGYWEQGLLSSKIQNLKWRPSSAKCLTW